MINHLKSVQGVLEGRADPPSSFFIDVEIIIKINSPIFWISIFREILR
jgi:hypothetical protein